MDIQSDKKHAYLDQYKIIRTLGAGYHAQVKLGVDEQGTYVAIKKYKKETATIQTLKHELNIMKQLDHENLVRLLSVRQNATYKNEDESTYNCFAIVLQFVGGGQLFDFVAQTGKFSEKVTRTYFHQMMNGLHFMHLKGYAHRDIKPENILLSHLFILKLADFGFSALLKGKDGTGILKTKLGTQGYMAPQIPTKKYEGKSVDIFASGVILFIMYAGNPPFEKATPNDPYYKIIKQKKYEIFWKAHSRKRPAGFFSETFKDLFQRLVAFQPSERLKIQEIAAHPWVKDSVCTHNEIKEQFNLRQKKLDAVLSQRRSEQQKQKQNKLTGVSTQGGHSRGNQQHSQFTAIYNKQFSINRNLPTFEITSKDEIIRKEVPSFSIAILKEFLNNHQVKLAEVAEQQQIIGDQTDVLKFTKINDDGNNTINIVYTYSFEVDQIVFTSNVQIDVKIGQTPSKETIFKFERVDGDLLYFKKIVNDLRLKCFAA